ncbi:MAG TPA: hypothetical protein VFB26_12030 [Gaiellaceae bacterium]|nr:hypothetical protein [Gaiellaceae bacterium]
MGIEDIATFHDDDDGYEAWVRHTRGYVLTERLGGTYMLHDSECTHLTGNGKIRLTRRPRRCARNRQDLVTWTLEATGQRPLLCQSCM